MDFNIFPKENIVMRKWFGACFFALIVLLGCRAQETAQEAEEPSPADEPEMAQEVVAVAKLAPKSGSELSGRAEFTKTNGETQFEVTIENVEPGPHAVHIHETGDCSAEDASTAGGHWNPTGEEHGKWGEAPFHLGDIGNIEVGEDGKGSLTMSTDIWSLGDSSDHDVVGKAIVVHSGADDFESQPSGAAGERIGCGVIEMKEQGGEM
jgi:Cu-Zn family superoxide dismutase